MNIEAIREARVGIRIAIPSKEISLPAKEASPKRLFVDRVADVLLAAVVGNGFRLVEILGEGMEKVYRGIDRGYARQMEELERYYSAKD